MSTLYMIFGTLIALGVLVTIHEFGHFWVARRCGVRVLRFSVGFGTPLLRWHDRQGTEFVVAAIPLGGYVKMLDEREGEVPSALLPQSFNRKPVGARIAIVAAGPLANFLLALLLFWLVAMLGESRLAAVVGGVQPGSPAAVAGLPAGAELLAVDDESVTGWRDTGLQLLGRIGDTGQLLLRARLADSSIEQDFQLPLQDFMRGVEEPDPLQALGIAPWQPAAPPVIGRLDPDGPGAAGGLREGDRLLRLNDAELGDWTDMIQRLRALPGAPVKLQLERDGRTQELSLVLGERGGQGYLGAGAWPASMLREVRYGPLDAVGVAMRQTLNMSWMTLQSIGKMLTGDLSVKNLSGPITIAKVAGTSAQSGLGEFLGFLAYLSISLGVLNLLPIPVLDGGHLLFYLVEWLRGRPVPERAQEVGMQIGVSLVIGLMLLALFNDIGRL